MEPIDVWEAFCPHCDDFVWFDTYPDGSAECGRCGFTAEVADIPFDAGESDRLREDGDIESWEFPSEGR